MQIRYKGAQGIEVSRQLGSDPMVIGRSSDVTMTVDDKNASRQHCEIRQWDQDYVIKDLNSRNGTFVNGQRIEVALLRMGDEITVGDTLLIFEDKPPLGSTTALRQVEHLMEKEGKGYRTIMREIVCDIDEEKEDRSGQAGE